MFDVDRSPRSVVVTCTVPGCGARDVLDAVTAAAGGVARWQLRHLDAAHPQRTVDRRRIVASRAQAARRDTRA